MVRCPHMTTTKIVASYEGSVEIVAVLRASHGVLQRGARGALAPGAVPRLSVTSTEGGVLMESVSQGNALALPRSGRWEWKVWKQMADGLPLRVGNLVVVTVAGAAGVIAVPRWHPLIHRSIHLVSSVDLPLVYIADLVCGLVVGCAGVMLLGRLHRVADRGLKAAHVVAYAALIPAGAAGTCVFAGLDVDAALLQNMTVVSLGVLLSMTLLRRSAAARGGRAWLDRGGRLDNGAGY